MGKEEDHGKAQDVNELGRIADVGGAGQGIDKLVKRREAAKGEQQGDENNYTPEPQTAPLLQRIRRVLFTKRLRGTPQADQRDQHTDIVSAAGEAVDAVTRRSGLRIFIGTLVRGVTADTAPIFTAARSIHAIAEQAGDDDGKSF